MQEFDIRLNRLIGQLDDADKAIIGQLQELLNDPEISIIEGLNKIKEYLNETVFDVAIGERQFVK